VSDSAREAPPATDPATPATRERRRYYRVEDEVALSYRVLEGAEVDAALERFTPGFEDTMALAATFATTGGEMRRALDAVKRSAPEVATYLEGLNTKLDILGRMLAARESGLPSSPTHLVSLSASGISFDVTRPITPGSLLELKLLVFPSHICLLTLGAVVSCRPLPETQADFRFRVGIDFAYIRDTDRETLIRHVVQKQSQLLRQRRPDRE